MALTQEEMEKALTDLAKQVEDLQYLFLNHQHVGYDQTMKLKLANLGIYICEVNDDGTAISLPDGWTSALASTGHYTITHGLNTTAYKVFAIVNAGTFAMTQTSGNTSTVAHIYVFNTSGTQVDRDIYVLLVKDPN